MDPLKARRIREFANHYLLSFGIALVSGVFLGPVFKTPFWIIALVFGFCFGTAFLLIDHLSLGKWKHRSFLVTSLVRTGAYGAAICLGFFSSIATIIYLGSPWSIVDRRFWELVLRVVFGPISWAGILPALLIAFGISTFIAISKKLGPGVIVRWITGKYHTPRAEERVFMFLDIRDSTTLAEELGDLRFSALVRDFMADLSEPVIRTRAEVSHYIGDEAVLVWLPERAFQKDACVRLFTLMRERLAKRAPHYMDQYGIVPGFKAGIHRGTSIVTEVGEIKSEIVYHGDTLNTTARIQGLCNELGYELLVSEAVAERLTEKGVPVGQHSLKGKAEPVMLRGFEPVPVFPANVKA